MFFTYNAFRRSSWHDVAILLNKILKLLWLLLLLWLVSRNGRLGRRWSTDGWWCCHRSWTADLWMRLLLVQLLLLLRGRMLLLLLLLRQFADFGGRQVIRGRNKCPSVRVIGGLKWWVMGSENMPTIQIARYLNACINVTSFSSIADWSNSEYLSWNYLQSGVLSWCARLYYTNGSIGLFCRLKLFIQLITT